jgi:hypothetical protein
MKTVFGLSISILLIACSRTGDTPATPLGANDAGTESGSTDGSSPDGPAQADADAAASGPSPATIFGPKLTLWLDASEPSTVELDSAGRITKWHDRSSNMDDALAMRFFSDTNDRIVLQAGAVNMRSAMKFGGTRQTGGVFQVLRFGSTSDFALTFIVAYENATEAYLYNAGASPVGAWLVANLGATTDAGASVGRLAGGIIFGMFGGSERRGAQTPTTGWNDGKFHVVTLRRDNAQQAMFLRVDGSETRSETAIDPASVTQNVYAQIGGVWNPGSEGAPPGVDFPLDGMIAEVIEVQTVPSSSESAALASYVNDKYALTF